jgi:hypothetical protein
MTNKQQKALCIDIDLVSGIALGCEFEWDERGTVCVLSVGILRLYIGFVDLEKLDED